MEYVEYVQPCFFYLFSPALLDVSINRLYTWPLALRLGYSRELCWKGRDKDASGPVSSELFGSHTGGCWEWSRGLPQKYKAGNGVTLEDAGV